MSSPYKVNGVDFFRVMIRVRRATTTYLGAQLPVPSGRSDEFFDLMELVAKERDGCRNHQSHSFRLIPSQKGTFPVPRRRQTPATAAVRSRPKLGLVETIVRPSDSHHRFQAL